MSIILGADGQPYNQNIRVAMGIKFGLFFRTHLFHKFSGKTIKRTPWQHNLLLDQGLNQWGATIATPYFKGVKVGAGNSTPNVSQTDLDSYLGVNDTEEDVQRGADQDASLDWYQYTRFVWRFNAGNATGNIAELGPTYDKLTGQGDALISRELVRDGLGDPTVIAKGSDEILDIDYEIRGYQDTNDVVLPGQMINGVSTTVTVRPANINTAHTLDYAMRPQGGSFDWDVYDGEIQGITSLPSGASSQRTSTSFSAYSEDDLFIDVAAFYDVDQGNFAGGIGAAAYRMNAGTWQIGFNPHIMKLNTQNITLNYRMNWSRKTIS
jgi:hypothetical protein